MSLRLILGPMFAGKSSHALVLIRRYKEIDYTILSITSALDTRYSSDEIHTHNHEVYPALSLRSLMPVTSSLNYALSKVIIIEEAQFFSDLVAFVLRAVEVDKKEVIVVGLDGDAERKPFGQILELIPFCDEVTKMSAFCKMCGNGTNAIFTHRKIPSQDTILIGDSDQYEALCRRHYITSSTC